MSLPTRRVAGTAPSILPVQKAAIAKPTNLLLTTQPLSILANLAFSCQVGRASTCLRRPTEEER
jgi:hypothetical protein